MYRIFSCSLGLAWVLATSSATLAQVQTPQRQGETATTRVQDIHTRTQQRIFNRFAAGYYEKPDPSGYYAIVYTANQAAVPDLERLRIEAADTVYPLPDRRQIISLIEGYVARRTTEIGARRASALADISNQAIDYLERSDKPTTHTIPRDVALTHMQALWNSMPEEKRRLLAAFLGERVDLKYETVLSEEADGEQKTREGTTEIARKVAETNAELLEKLVRNELERQQQSRRQIDAPAEELKRDGERFRAGVILANQLMDIANAPTDLRKTVRVAEEGFKIYESIQRFGSGQIQPDKFLMFTNVATAGLAIVAIIGSSQEDPTMKALRSISAQLVAIQKQLNRIEDKVDNLLLEVVSGFDKVVNGQVLITDRLTSIEERLRIFKMDEAQRRAVERYVEKAVELEGILRALVLDCADSTRRGTEVAHNCAVRFSALFGTDVAVPVPQTQDVMNPNSANLTLCSAARLNNGDIRLEELTLPLLFQSEVETLLYLYERNAAALNCVGRSFFQNDQVSVPHAAYLAAASEVYLQTLGNLGPDIKTETAIRVTEKALERLKALRKSVEKTSGSIQHIVSVFDKLERHANSYSNESNRLFDGLRDSEFAGQRRFGGAGKIPRCGVEPGRTWADIVTPRAGNLTAAAWVPSELWIAESLGHIQLGSCYLARLVSERSAKRRGGAEYLPVSFNLRFYYRAFASPAVVDTAQWAPFDDKDVHTFSERTAFAPQELSLYWSYGNELIPYAWTRISTSKVVYGCVQDPPRDAICEVKDEEQLFLTFIGSSTETVSVDKVDTLSKAARELAAEDLTKLLIDKSNLWDDTALVRSALMPIEPRENEVRTRPIWGTSRLDSISNAYSETYYYALGLAMLGVAHNNPMGKCLEMLSDLHPQAVLPYLARESYLRSGKSYRDIRGKFNNLHSACQWSGLRPEFDVLERQLGEALRKQLAGN